MPEIVWHYRAWKSLVEMLTKAGMDEYQAIECAYMETKAQLPERAEWKTPEDMAEAAFEAMTE